MTSPRSPAWASTSTLVLRRTVGEGFSLGEDWRFHVLHLTARFVTLAVTDGSRITDWRLESDDSLQIAANTVACLRRARCEPAPLEVRVTRVSTHCVTLLIHAPRSLQIVRYDSAAAGRAS